MNYDRMPCHITDLPPYEPIDTYEDDRQQAEVKPGHVDELVLQEIMDGCNKVRLKRNHVFKYQLDIETYHTTYSDSLTIDEVEGLAAFCEQFLKEYHNKER